MSVVRERLNRLLIVLAERPSAWIAKGEVIDRYYNPAGLFRHVDILLTNDDRPDTGAIQRMVGDAEWKLHNFPTPPRFFRRMPGSRSKVARAWAADAVELARRTRPQLVRCYGAHVNTLIAAEIKRAVGVPYAVSLHINPDVDIRGRHRRPVELARAHVMRSIERRGLREADLVLPVYQSIVPFLERIGVERYEVAYNMLNARSLVRKANYSLGQPAKIVSVGRQFRQKRPDNLIRAVARLPGAHLTLVGDGPDHEYLRELANKLGLTDRVRFEPAIPNDELIARLPDFDVFATHSEFWELSKAVLEAFLAGLPAVVNERRGAPVPELTPDICALVKNSIAGYQQGLERLLADPGLRERLGRAGAARADREWAPQVTEQRFAELYRGLARVGAARDASPVGDH